MFKAIFLNRDGEQFDAAVRTISEDELARLQAQASELAGEHPELLPPDPPIDALAQSRHLLELAESAPKGVKWKLRANVGDRVRWYEEPEEVGH